MPARSSTRSSRRANSSDEDDHFDRSGSDRAYRSARTRKVPDLEKGRTRRAAKGRAMYSLGAARNDPDPEPLVRPSKKSTASRGQGRYAPVAQGGNGNSTGESELSDHDRAPKDRKAGQDQHSQTSGESEDEQASAIKGRTPAASGKASDPEAGQPPQGSRSRKSWWIAGGIAVLIIIIIAIGFAVLKNSASSDATTVGSESDDASSEASSLGGSDAASSATVPSDALDTADLASNTAQATNEGGMASSATIPGTEGAAQSTDPSQSSDATSSGPSDSVDSMQTTLSATTKPTDASGQNVTSQTTETTSESPVVHTSPTSHTAEATKTKDAGTSATADATQTSSASQEDATVKVSTTATWYLTEQQTSACGTTPSDTDLVAAIPPDLFVSNGSSTSPLCGTELKIWCPDSNQTISVTIGDECPGCPTSTSLDLTQGAFLALAPNGTADPETALGTGVLSIQWWFADPTVASSLGFSLDDGLSS